MSVMNAIYALSLARTFYQVTRQNPTTPTSPLVIALVTHFSTVTLELFADLLGDTELLEEGLFPGALAFDGIEGFVGVVIQGDVDVPDHTRRIRSPRT